MNACTRLAPHYVINESVTFLPMDGLELYGRDTGCTPGSSMEDDMNEFDHELIVLYQCHNLHIIKRAFKGRRKGHLCIYHLIVVVLL